MRMPSRDDILKYWPILTVAAASLVAWGGTAQRISTLEAQAEVAAADHDRIVRIDESQKHMRETLEEIKRAIERLSQPK